MPLAEPPPRDSRFGSPLKLSRVHWGRPEVVVEVTYLTWTEDDLLRQVSSAIFAEVGNRGEAARYALGTGVPLNKLEALMKRIAVAVVLAAMGVAVPSWAATDAECQE